MAREIVAAIAAAEFPSASCGRTAALSITGRSLPEVLR